MRTPLRLLAVAAISAVVLTGCVRVQVDLELQSDDTVDGTMVLALQSGVGELLDTTDPELADQLFGDAAEPFNDAVIDTYQLDDYVGQKVTFEGQPIAKLALGTGDLTVTRDGNLYVLDGVIDATEAANGADIPASADITLSVTFPGPVYEHNGTLEGRTVTWDLTTTPDQLHAEGAAAQSTTGAPPWLAGAIGGALLLGVALLLVIALRRRAAPGAGGRTPSHTTRRVPTPSLKP
jgi:hypothetical protein